MNIKEIIKHFRTQAQSRFNPSPDGSREKYYEGRKDAYNDCADVLERYAVKYPNGWHPASEPPIIPKGKNWIKVIALVDYGDGLLRPKHEIYKDKGWNNLLNWKIELWCYPPKED